MNKEPQKNKSDVKLIPTQALEKATRRVFFSNATISQKQAEEMARKVIAERQSHRKR